MVALANLVPGGTLFRLGSSGPAVRQFQLALAKFGYPLSGTGFFGQATDTAVTDFQRLHGLHVDGVIGRQTAHLLDEALAVKSSGKQSPIVTEVVERPLWLSAGLKLIGVKETPGSKNNPDIIDWAKEEHGEIAESYTADSIPWCALFINHILSLGGQKGTGTLWALDFAGSIWPGVRLQGPAVGAIAPMVRSGGGHVICVVGKDQHGNIMGLGGNQSDQVSVIPFPTSRLNKGFWWPKYAPMPPKIGMDELPVVLSDGRISTKEA